MQDQQNERRNTNVQVNISICESVCELIRQIEDETGHQITIDRYGVHAEPNYTDEDWDNDDKYYPIPADFWQSPIRRHVGEWDK